MGHICWYLGTSPCKLKQQNSVGLEPIENKRNTHLLLAATAGQLELPLTKLAATKLSALQQRSSHTVN
jgi:hypothetical protein